MASAIDFGALAGEARKAATSSVALASALAELADGAAPAPGNLAITENQARLLIPLLTHQCECVEKAAEKDEARLASLRSASAALQAELSEAAQAAAIAECEAECAVQRASDARGPDAAFEAAAAAAKEEAEAEEEGEEGGEGEEGEEGDEGEEGEEWSGEGERDQGRGKRRRRRGGWKQRLKDALRDVRARFDAERSQGASGSRDPPARRRPR